MKRELTLNIDGHEVTVTADRKGDNIIVEREGKEYSVRILSESIVGIQAASRQPTGSVQVAATSRSTPPRRPSPSQPASGAGVSAGEGAVLSPMTGVIDQVLVTEGASVNEGDKVIILEAMKMYIDVMAPVSGSVVSVSVKAGESVKEGQPLVTIA